MAIPVLKLNLAPPPTFWRRQHVPIGWAALVVGVVAVLLVSGMTWRAYSQANRMGREAFLLSRQTQASIARQTELQSQLRSINVQKELPRWRLAERILLERSSPWSRLTAELERSLVQDVRIRTLQRTKGNDQQVILKLKAEARSREAETAFVESLQKNGFFSQVVLERETERQGGGVEFEFTLPVSLEPPAFQALPKFGPGPKAASQAVAPKPAPKPAPAPAPRASAPVAPAPQPVAAAQRPAISQPATPPEPHLERPVRELPQPGSDDENEPRRRIRPMRRADQEVRR